MEKTCEHLFIECPFAKDCWNLLGISFQMRLNISDCVTQLKTQTHPVFYTMVAILMCWAVWTVRNGFIFKNVQPSVQAAKETFKKELSLLSLGAKAKVSVTFDLWIQNLL